VWPVRSRVAGIVIAPSYGRQGALALRLFGVRGL
jgi:hypothetical protein